MYPFYLIFTLSKILASNEHNRFCFVTDKTIKKILKDDGSVPLEVELKEYTVGNDIETNFIWDKNVLKPESYFIDCQTFMNFDTETKLLLKCISNNDDEIFKFEIENKNGKLQEPNFYDTNNSKLNFKKWEKEDHVYFVSNREENAKSVRIYLEYMLKANKLRSSFHVIIGKFYKFIKPIRAFRERITDFKEYNKSYVLKIWEAEKCVLGIINTLLKTLSTLSIPSVNKLEFLKSYEHCKKDMENLYNMIESLVDIFFEDWMRHWRKGVGKKYFWQYIFIEKADTILEDLKEDGSDSINQNYKGLLKSLESLNLLVKGIMEKNAANNSITFDCDVETVDKFIKKYSSHLLEYCNIFDNVDELFLNEFYYRSNEVCYRTDFKNLEQLHIDILIAKEMKKYLLNYENDKTDFLIFSKTDYFMNKLSKRMNNNLNDLYALLKHKDVIFTTKTRNMAFNQNSEDDIIHYEKIEKLQKKLESVFNSDSFSVPQTFKKIIDNLDNKPVQNDIESSRINSDGVNLNANDMQLENQIQESLKISEESQFNEDQNQESTQSNEEVKLNEDKNQESTQENEEVKLNEDQNQDSAQENDDPKYNEDQNQESTQENEDQTFDKNRLEENPKSSDNKFFIDEPKQINSDITNGTNLQLNNKNDQKKEQKSIKDIEVENKTKRNESKKLEGNDKEKIKALQNNKQNPKETLKQQNNKRNHDKSNKSNNQINDKPGQNERQIKSSENESNLGDDQKKINENKINNNVNPEKNDKITTEKQNDKSTFLDKYSIYIICGFAIASCILGVSIYYFRSS